MTFVGEHHHQMVDELVTLFNGVGQTGLPRLVSVEAPLGWGKTRVVQELYARLAERQQYWPATLDVDLEDDPHRRKRVEPKLGSRFAPLAPLPWMWWGISCARRQTGEAAQVLADDVAQLISHRGELADRPARRQAFRRSTESTASFLLGLASPPIGIVVGGAIAFRDAHGAARARQHARRTEGFSDAQVRGRQTLVDEALELLRAMGAAQIPLVMVIDDAHDADESLISLLDRLVVRPTPIPALIVTTSQPSATGLGPVSATAAFGSWVEQSIARCPARVKRIRLPALSARALAKMARARVPRTDCDVLDALAARADGNPLILEGLLSESARNRTDSGRLALSVRDVAALPNTYEALLAERWRRLPAAVQRALAIASMHGPTFVRGLVLHIAELAFGDDAETTDAALTQAVEPLAYLREQRASLSFVQDYDYGLARTHLSELLTVDEVIEMHIATAEQVTAWRGKHGGWQRIPPGAQRILLRVHVHAARQVEASRGHDASIDWLAASAAEAEIADSYVAEGKPTSALPLIEQNLAWIESADADHLLAIASRESLAGAYSALHRHEDALAALQRATADRERICGSHDVLTLHARMRLGSVLHDLERYAEALAVQIQAASDAEEIFGTNSEPHLVTLFNVAGTLFTCNRFEASRRLLARVLREHERTVGPSSADTLNVRDHLARALAELERPDEALSMQRDVVEGSVRAHGPDHTQTLRHLSGLAKVLGAAGRHAVARRLLEPVLSRQAHLLGRDDAQTLESALRLSAILDVLGEYELALALRRERVEALTRTRGSERPSTLVARHEVVVGLNRPYISGAPPPSNVLREALELLIPLAVDADRLLPADSDTRSTITHHLSMFREMLGSVTF